MFAGLIVGVGLTLAVLALQAFAKEKGFEFTWWQWLLMAIGTFVFLFGVGFLGTSIAEEQSGAGFFMLGVSVVVTVILGAIVARTVQRA